MATVAELKERLQSLNRRTSKAKDIWKPSDEHDVRLLPYPHGDEPFITLYFHYDIGDASVLCPKSNFGEDCAICDFCDALKAYKDSRGNQKPEADKKADWEIFKKIQPKATVAVAMIERGKEADGAKFWRINSYQAQELLGICAEGERLAALGLSPDDTGAINVLFGVDKGFDVHVSFAKAGEKGNAKTFNVTTVKGNIMPKPLAKDKASTDAILASVKNIREVYPKVSSSEVERLLKKFMGNQSAEANLEGGTEVSVPKDAAPANTKENALAAGSRSVDEAFNDLLAE